MSLIRLISKLAANTNRNLVTLTHRRLDESQKFTDNKSEGEKKLIVMLNKRFPTAAMIQVNDVSGGCGAMYEIYVETDEFKNVRMVKQHQMVNEALKNEIVNNMHGVRIFTAVPK